jgi:2-polyprenyl-3-methyl-5-hydroxy-6-metoxy-1,4-benzoquinol methylase
MTSMPASEPSELPPELRGERGRWERLARDPYYAVINDEVYRGEQLAGEVKAQFERSGEVEVALTLAEIREWIDPGFQPRQAVDFGCGAGRLTLPLARECGHVTGIDISEAMLAEAERNAASRGVRNVSFVSTTDYFGARAVEQPQPDFIHSYIVFQHVPPRAGIWITNALLERLAPGGVGALHYTFARRASVARRIAHRLRRVVPGVNLLANVMKHRPLLEPLIPMQEYDLAELFALLGDHGCVDVHVRLTDHGGHLGAMLVFRRP